MVDWMVVMVGEMVRSDGREEQKNRKELWWWAWVLVMAVVLVVVSETGRLENGDFVRGAKPPLGKADAWSAGLRR